MLKATYFDCQSLVLGLQLCQGFVISQVLTCLLCCVRMRLSYVFAQLVVLGGGCDNFIRDPIVAAVVKQFQVPVLVFGAYLPTPFISALPSEFPYYLRVTLPSTAEARMLLSLMSFYSWQRVGIVATNDTYGNLAYDSLAAVADSYGAQLPQVSFTTPAMRNTSAMDDIFIRFRKNGLNVIMLVLGDPLDFDAVFLSAYRTGFYRDPAVQFVATYQAAASALLYFAPLPSFEQVNGAPNINFPPTMPPWWQAAYGMVYSNYGMDTNAPQLLAFLSNFSVTYGRPYPTPIPYSGVVSYDAVYVAAQALGILAPYIGTSSTQDSYSPFKLAVPWVALDTALRSVNIQGAYGRILFRPRTNDRTGAAFGFTLWSWRKNSGVGVQFGHSDDYGQMILVSDPVERPGQALTGKRQMISACSSGSIPSAQNKTIQELAADGTQRVFRVESMSCDPCPAQFFAPLNSAVCKRCPHGDTCYLGSSVPYSSKAPFLVAKTTNQPITLGQFALDEVVTAFYEKYYSLLYAFFGIFTTGSVVFAILPKNAERWLDRQGYMEKIKKWDFVFHSDHPSQLNTPFIKRQTVQGAYWSIALVTSILCVLAWLSETYIVLQYLVDSNYVLGTGLLTNPTVVTATLIFVSIDNFVNCQRICTNPGLFYSDLPGITRTCEPNLQLATCTVTFSTTKSDIALPRNFKVSLIYQNTRGHGLYYYVTGCNWLGKSYGTMEYVETAPGTVMFGPSKNIISIALQPYVFQSQPDVPLSQAPAISSGYLAKANTMYIRLFSWTLAFAFVFSFFFASPSCFFFFGVFEYLHASVCACNRVSKFVLHRVVGSFVISCFSCFLSFFSFLSLSLYLSLALSVGSLYV
jgi:hypothetical protein